MHGSKVEDDIILCTKMDRLGRNTADMIRIVDTCYKKGIAIRFLENGLSTEGTMGSPTTAGHWWYCHSGPCYQLAHL